MKKFNLMFAALMTIATTSAFAGTSGYNMRDPNLALKPKAECAKRAAAERKAANLAKSSVAPAVKAKRGDSTK